LGEKHAQSAPRRLRKSKITYNGKNLWGKQRTANKPAKPECESGEQLCCQTGGGGGRGFATPWGKKWSARDDRRVADNEACVMEKQTQIGEAEKTGGPGLRDRPAEPSKKEGRQKKNSTTKKKQKHVKKET